MNQLPQVLRQCNLKLSICVYLFNGFIVVHIPLFYRLIIYYVLSVKWCSTSLISLLFQPFNSCHKWWHWKYHVSIHIVHRDMKLKCLQPQWAFWKLFYHQMWERYFLTRYWLVHILMLCRYHFLIPVLIFFSCISWSHWFNRSPLFCF